MLDNTRLAAYLIGGGILLWVIGFLFMANPQKRPGCLTWIPVIMILLGILFALLEFGGRSYWFAYYVLRPLRELVP